MHAEQIPLLFHLSVCQPLRAEGEGCSILAPLSPIYGFVCRPSLSGLIFCSLFTHFGAFPFSEQLAEKGVEVLACRNSLRSLNMAEEDLAGFVRVVPAGITELVRRQ